MAQKTKAELIAELTANFPDNVIGAITAEIYRGFITNFLDSAVMDILPIEVPGSLTIDNTYSDNTFFRFTGTSPEVWSLEEGSTFHPGFFFWIERDSATSTLQISPSGSDTINQSGSNLVFDQNKTGGILLFVGGTEWNFLPLISNYAGLTDGMFLTANASGNIKPSSLTETTDRIVSTKPLEVPPGTLILGPETYMGAAIRALSLRSGITGNLALILAQLYDTVSGFSEAFVYSGGPVETVVINDPPGVETADFAQFILTTTADELIESVSVQTSQLSQSVSFDVVIRVQSHSGPVAYTLDGEVNTDASGFATLLLAEDGNPILVDSGTDLYITINCDDMVGSTGSGTFIPNGSVDRIVTERKLIATQEWVQSLFNPPSSFSAQLTSSASITTTNSGQFYKVPINLTPSSEVNIVADNPNNAVKYTGASDKTVSFMAQLAINIDDDGTQGEWELRKNNTSLGISAFQYSVTSDSTLPVFLLGRIDVSQNDLITLHVKSSKDDALFLHEVVNIEISELPSKIYNG